jgi:hypothetical protein
MEKPWMHHVSSFQQPVLPNRANAQQAASRLGADGTERLRGQDQGAAAGQVPLRPRACSKLVSTMQSWIRKAKTHMHYGTGTSPPLAP